MSCSPTSAKSCSLPLSEKDVFHSQSTFPVVLAFPIAARCSVSFSDFAVLRLSERPALDLKSTFEKESQLISELEGFSMKSESLSPEEPALRW